LHPFSVHTASGGTCGSTDLMLSDVILSDPLTRTIPVAVNITDAKRKKRKNLYNMISGCRRSSDAK